MANPALFRDLLSILSVGCGLAIDFDEDNEYVEFSTNTALKFYLMQTEKSSAITLAIPIEASGQDDIGSMLVAPGILNFFEVCTEHGKISLTPDLSAMIYLSKWRENYGRDQDLICGWLADCLSEAERCNNAILESHYLYRGES